MIFIDHLISLRWLEDKRHSTFSTFRGSGVLRYTDDSPSRADDRDLDIIDNYHQSEEILTYFIIIFIFYIDYLLYPLFANCLFHSCKYCHVHLDSVIL